MWKGLLQKPYFCQLTLINFLSTPCSHVQTLTFSNITYCNTRVPRKTSASDSSRSKYVPKFRYVEFYELQKTAYPRYVPSCFRNARSFKTVEFQECGRILNQEGFVKWMVSLRPLTLNQLVITNTKANISHEIFFKHLAEHLDFDIRILVFIRMDVCGITECKYIIESLLR